MTPRGMRRIRSAGIALAVLSVATTIGTIDREIGVRSGSGWMVCVGDGCLQVGFNPTRFSFAGDNDAWFGPLGVYTMRGWHFDWATSWRPFRVSVPPAELLVVPLWPTLPLSAGLVGWSVGWLAGIRRARGRSCLTCGYDLERVPVADGARTCPECGAKRGEV